MTRIEENKMIRDKLTEEAKRKPAGTYDEIVAFQLGVIATMLADISKSLAILTDKSESGDKE